MAMARYEMNMNSINTFVFQLRSHGTYTSLNQLWIVVRYGVLCANTKYKRLDAQLQNFENFLIWQWGKPYQLITNLKKCPIAPRLFSAMWICDGSGLESFDLFSAISALSAISNCLSVISFGCSSVSLLDFLPLFLRFGCKEPSSIV